MLYCYKQCCKLATQIPDHNLCVLIYDHLIKVHAYFDNNEGALKCCIKMRNVAQDHSNLQQEIKALVCQVRILQKMRSYPNAIEAAKTLLLVTWIAKCIPDELHAYELLSKQYYYNGQLSKSAYY